MKIEAIFQPSSEKMLPPTQKKVLSFFRKFSDEVFPYACYWDPNLLQELGNMKASYIDWCILTLQRVGFLHREKVRGRYYFGLPDTIGQLREEKNKVERLKRMRDLKTI